MPRSAGTVATSEYTVEQKISIYEMFRKRIVEDDILISNRMLWLIFSESVIVATWATIEIKIIDQLTSPSVDQITILLIILSLFGLATSLLTLISVIAAHTQINHLRNRYQSRFQTVHDDASLPELIGSGATDFFGRLVPWVVPTAFAVLLGYMTIYSWHLHNDCRSTPTGALKCVAQPQP